MRWVPVVPLSLSSLLLASAAEPPRSPSVNSGHCLSHLPSILHMELVSMFTVFKTSLMVPVNMNLSVSFSLPFLQARQPFSVINLPAGDRQHQRGAFWPVTPALPCLPDGVIPGLPPLLECHGSWELGFSEAGGWNEPRE